MRWSVFLTIVSVLSASAAPQIAWKASYGFGTNSDSKVFALALDSEQNLLVAGTSKNDQGNYDYVTVKYSPAGENIWTRRYDSGGNDQARGLALDSEGNAVLTGTSVTLKYSREGLSEWIAPFGGLSLALDGSNNVVVTGFSTEDFATAKLTPQGSNVWVRFHDRIGKPDISQAVTVDKSGNVYVAGTQTWNSDQAYCCYSQFYILKYDRYGNQQWITNVASGAMGFGGEPWGPKVKGLIADAAGNVFFTANCQGSPSWIYLTARFSEAGQKVWSRQHSRTGGAGVQAMALDASGNAYVTGGMYGWPEDDGYFYFKTFKIDSSGANVWESGYRGQQPLSENHANALTLDPAWNTYVSGQSTGSGTGSDWATIKYNASGQEQWVVRYDGPVHGEDQATALAVDNTGAIYAAGFTTTTNGIEMLVIKYVELQPIQVQTNQCVLLQFLGTPGQSYRFQATTNFSNWDELGAAIADPLGLYHWLDTNPPVAPRKFYRTVTP